MTRSRWGRVWFGITAAVVFFGLGLQVVVAIRNPVGHFHGALARTFNVFCYFTTESNLIVAITCLLLAIRLSRPSLVFQVFRLDGVLAITVTFVVFHKVLAPFQELSGGAAVADTILHTVSPILCVVGWLVFGPRGVLNRRVVGWSLAWPVAWLVFTLVRGPLVDWYPYPFMDVREHGYAVVLLNCAVVAVVFLALAGVAAVLDRWLGRGRSLIDEEQARSSEETPNHAGWGDQHHSGGHDDPVQH